MKNEYPDPKLPDMSPAAIDVRLRVVEAIRKLGVSLREAGERGPILVTKKLAADAMLKTNKYEGVDQ